MTNGCDALRNSQFKDLRLSRVPSLSSCVCMTIMFRICWSSCHEATKALRHAFLTGVISRYTCQIGRLLNQILLDTVMLLTNMELQPFRGYILIAFEKVSG